MLFRSEIRCQTSVKFMSENGFETSGRSTDELVKLCMELPSDHAPFCGIPGNDETYSIVENQSCVAKQAGLTSHAVMAKAEKRAEPRREEANEEESDTGSGASAQ